MASNISFAGGTGTIIVASCVSLPDARATLRWIAPLVAEWPAQAVGIWICDAVDCEDARAAQITDPSAEPQWRRVDASDFDGDGTVCQMLSGKLGLVILTHETIAAQLLRALEGLVAGLVCISTSDPLAKPFKKSFASFGVTAGI
ncbi:MAG: hypothetical protein KDK89_23325 [Alphaproteobacteria bacterium]|nr:hypothetical protein [Alphaproteobacteria bacterium]